MITVPEMKCLTCGHKLNQASDLDDALMPAPGDFTVCIYCETLMVFKDDLTFRHPTNEEAIEANSSGAVTEVRELVRKYREMKEARVSHTGGERGNTDASQKRSSGNDGKG